MRPGYLVDWFAVLDAHDTPAKLLVIEVHPEDNLLAAFAAGELVDLGGIVTHSDTHGVRLVARLAL